MNFSQRELALNAKSVEFRADTQESIATKNDGAAERKSSRLTLQQQKTGKQPPKFTRDNNKRLTLLNMAGMARRKSVMGEQITALLPKQQSNELVQKQATEAATKAPQFDQILQLLQKLCSVRSGSTLSTKKTGKVNSQESRDLKTVVSKRSLQDDQTNRTKAYPSRKLQREASILVTNEDFYLVDFEAVKEFAVNFPQFNYTRVCNEVRNLQLRRRKNKEVGTQRVTQKSNFFKQNLRGFNDSIQV